MSEVIPLSQHPGRRDLDDAPPRLLESIEFDDAIHVKVTFNGKTFFMLKNPLHEGGGCNIHELIDSETGVTYMAKTLNQSSLEYVSELSPGLVVEGALGKEIGNHNNLVKMIGVGVYTHESKEVNVIIMEKIPGKDLKELLKVKEYKNGLKNDEKLFLGIVESILNAVDHIHKAGYTHNDLNLANIMLKITTPQSGKSQVVKAVVIDLGSATKIADDPPPNGFAFVPKYTDPTLCSKIDPRRASIQTDIYSIGVLLGDMLFGTRWYPDKNNPIPIRKSDRNFDIDSDERSRHENVLAVIAMCLHINREARYRSVSDLKEAFSEAWEKDKEESVNFSKNRW